MGYKRKIILPLIVLGSSTVLYIFQSMVTEQSIVFFWSIALLYTFLAWWFGRDYDKLLEESRQDFLTKVYNRRSVPHIFRKLKKTADKTAQKILVFFVDVDNFKLINDTYGHSIGDLLLQKVAKGLQELFGEEEYIIRWGGDEFLVLLLWNDVTDVHLLQNNLLQLLCQQNEDIPKKVTFSIGHAIYPDEGISLQQILSAADKKMYQQKN